MINDVFRKPKLAVVSLEIRSVDSQDTLLKLKMQEYIGEDAQLRALFTLYFVYVPGWEGMYRRTSS